MFEDAELSERNKEATRKLHFNDERHKSGRLGKLEIVVLIFDLD